MQPGIRMEVFEVRTREFKRRWSSGTLGAPSSRGKMVLALSVAAVVSVACAALVIFNFVLSPEHQLTEEIELLHTIHRESLQDDVCELDFCDSKSCVATASRMLDLMDPGANPCEDFYAFACGGYGRTRAVPYNQDYYSPVKESLSNVLVNIKKMMESPPSDGESVVLSKTKLLYESCMNATLRDEQQEQSLRRWFSAIQLSFEGYEVENATDPDNFGSWRLLLSKLEEFQIHTVLRPKFEPIEDNPLGILHVDCLVPGLPPEAYLKPAEVENAYQLSLYKEAMDGALKELSLPKESRQRFVQDVLDMETEIARTIKRSPHPDVPTLSVEHKQQLREIWRPHVGNTLSTAAVRTSCDANLENILSELNNSPPRRSYVYVTWLMIRSVLPHLGNVMRDLHLHYLGRLPGLDSVLVARWKDCADVVRRHVGLVATKALIDAGYFTAPHLNELKDMFWEMKTDFAHVLRMVPWMDEVTMELFLEKLKGVQFTAGFSELINQTGFLDSLYHGLEMGNNYFLSTMNLTRFKASHYFEFLKTGDSEDPMRSISLDHSPLDTSASYDYIKNSANVDLGLLHSPLYRFDGATPKYLKYAQALTMARELSHTFDAIGVSYDGYGNRMDPNWWPQTVGDHFRNFTRCLTLQRDESLRRTGATSLHMARTETLNNIIADLGSFFITYAGLTMHLQAHGDDEKPIPGLPLNKKQTYFVQAAQTLCELRDKPSSDPRMKFLLPAKLRVNGAVRNTEVFGHVFNCSLGSPMNPALKCNLLH